MAVLKPSNQLLPPSSQLQVEDDQKFAHDQLYRELALVEKLLEENAIGKSNMSKALGKLSKLIQSHIDLSYFFEVSTNQYLKYLNSYTLNTGGFQEEMYHDFV